MRRRSVADPTGSHRADPAAWSRIAHADHGHTFGGSSVDAQPFEELKLDELILANEKARNGGVADLVLNSWS